MRFISWLDKLVVLLIIPIAVVGCIEQGSVNESNTEARLALLDRAYDVASAMPLNPHIKDRSRTQERVLKAALELDQPDRALMYAKDIANWRRGKGFADYAFYCVEHGISNGIPALLVQAESIAKAATQEWRQEAVRRRIKQVNQRLNQHPNSSEGVDRTVVEQYLNLVNKGGVKGSLDEAKGVINTCLSHYKTFYTSEDLRQQLQRAIKARWDSIPVFLRLNCMQQMATIALEHGDNPTALQRIEEAAVMMEDNSWPIEYSIPFTAQFAALRFRAGDHALARKELTRAKALFEERQNEIVDIDRAEVWVSLAEAAFRMSEKDLAASIYTTALDAAVLNPNSRPRADDISMICTSMAVQGFTPDTTLHTKLDRLYEGLGEPW